MILPVLHCCEKDAHLAIDALEVCRKLDGVQDLTIAVACDNPEIQQRVVKAAEKAFKSVLTILYSPTAATLWPQPQNHAWQSVARFIDQARFNQFTGWLWWEADSVPLKSGWIKTLSEAYRASKKRFAGVECQHGDSRYMNGVGIYPMNPVDALADCASLYCRTVPFDVAGGPCVLRSFENIDGMIVHHRKIIGGGSGLTFTPASYNDFLAKNPKAVLFHGCSDGTLHSFVSGKRRSVAAVQPQIRPKKRINGGAPLYTISVLCMNHSDLTKKCIESIAKFSDNYELIVTDNGSTDDTPALLKRFKKKLGEKITVITNRTNKGFQEPNEHALTLARGQYFVLFNNDMEACDGWLDSLRAPFDCNPRLALTGISNTCCTIDGNFRGQGAAPNVPPEYIEGGCLMTPCALVRKHGLFSPYLKFCYWEDTDLSLRMRELGYDIATVDVSISHDHRSSTSRHLDLREVIAHNEKAMWEKWRFYIQRRNFHRRILVTRGGARGDILLMTPALIELRKRYPQAEIEVVTRHPEMLAGMDVLANPTQLNPNNYYDENHTLDLSYESRPGVPIVDCFAEALGVKVKSHRPIMFASEADEAYATTVTRGLKVAIIHGGHTTWPGKNWPVKSFEKVVGALKTNGFFTIAIGAADSPDCGCDESITGETTPQQLYAVARLSSLFVGVDSMPQHIASAADVPSVVLFGATDPKCIMRQAPHLVAVQASRKNADCVGAHGRRKKAVTESPCDGACMKAITVDMVLSGIRQATRAVR